MHALDIAVGPEAFVALRVSISLMICFVSSLAEVRRNMGVCAVMQVHMSVRT